MNQEKLNLRQSKNSESLKINNMQERRKHQTFKMETPNEMDKNHGT